MRLRIEHAYVDESVAYLYELVTKTCMQTTYTSATSEGDHMHKALVIVCYPC